MKHLNRAINNIHKQLIETTDMELLNLFDQLKRINKRLNMEEYLRISNEKKLKDSILTLTTFLENDKDYFRAWSDNIAMSYKDAEHWYIEKYGKNPSTLNSDDKHIIANEAAKNFLNLLIKK